MKILQNADFMKTDESLDKIIFNARGFVLSKGFSFFFFFFFCGKPWNQTLLEQYRKNFVSASPPRFSIYFQTKKKGGEGIRYCVKIVHFIVVTFHVKRVIDTTERNRAIFYFLDAEYFYTPILSIFRYIFLHRLMARRERKGARSRRNSKKFYGTCRRRKKDGNRTSDE